MASEIELKPCPFCGGKAGFNKQQWNDDFSYRVECLSMHCDCFARTVWYETKSEAAAAWNRRRAMSDERQETVLVDTKFELCHDVDKVLQIGREFQKQDLYRGAHHDTAKLLCDTIEYLRECLNKPVGNAAAMRDALCEIALDCQYAIEGLSDKGDYGRSSLSRVLGKARTALSAPARNCDLFNNPEDAYEAWKEECKRVKNVYGVCRNCPYDTYKADSEKPSCVDMFLFAPAADRKGEGDGR